MLKTLLLINELTCRIGNVILLVVICCLSALRSCAIPFSVTGFVPTLLRAHVHAHYFACYSNVTVNICTLGSNVIVALAGSLVWWDSPEWLN